MKKTRKNIIKKSVPATSVNLNNDYELMRKSVERKHFEEALSSSEYFLNRIINQSPLPTWISDNKGTLIRINKACLDLLNISEADVIGKYNILKDNIVKEQGYLPLLKRVFNAGETAKFEIKYETSRLINLKLKKSVFVILESTIFPIRDVTGKITNAVIQHLDITERKHAVDALRASEERYKQLLDSVSDYIYTVKIEDGRPVATRHGPGCIAVTGYSSNEFEADPYLWYRMIHEDDRAAVSGQTANMFSGKEALAVDHRIFHKNGKVRWVRNTPVPRRNADGHLIGYDGLINDITERKQAEVALRESEDRFRKIFEDALISIVIVSPSFTFEKVNPVFCRMIGYSADELSSMTFADITHPDYLKQDWENVKKVGLGEIPFYQTEKQYIHKSGKIIWGNIIVSSIRDEHRVLRHYIAMVIDITERKQIEIALQTAKEYAENLIQTANTMVIGLDAKGAISVFNQAAQEITGYTRAELENRDWFETIVPRDRYPEVWAEFNRLSKGGLPARFENPILTKSGEERYVVWQNNLVHEQDRIVGTISFGMDITERRKAEEALRISEEKYRNIFENTIEGIFQITPEGKFININPSFAAMYAYESPEDLMTTITDIEKQIYVNPEERYYFTNTLEKSDIIVGFKHQAYRKDGSKFWVSLNAHVVRDIAGKICYYEGTALDITKSILAEEALRVSEEKYRNIFENTVEGIFQSTPDGKFINVNSSFASMYGYETPEEMMTTITDIKKQVYVNPEERIDFINTLENSGSIVGLNQQVYKKDGTKIWVSINAHVVRDANRRTLYYEGTVLDITKRIHFEEALRESEEKYRNIFENAVEGIFQSTPDGKYIDVNPSFASMLGYESPQELILSISDIKNQLFVIPEERDYIINILEKNNTIFGFEHQFYRKDGSKIWISVNARAIRNKNGKIIYNEGIAENINKRKQDEEEREKLHSQLRQAQKMEALGTFVGGIAHDFNNILSIIIGYATLLQMELDKDNPMRNYTDLILSSSEKAASLTQGLLAFSRKQPMNLMPLKLNNVIKGTEKLLKRLLTEDILLKKNLTKEKSDIIGDASQIDQILFNLTTNARDAMPNGGKLIIETKIVELDKEFINVIGYGRLGKYVLLSISDSGIGIDKDSKEHIFDPFFTTKEVGQGTGLGLSTVYGIVKQHNGYINVYSEPNIGTTFHIYFPSSKESVKGKREASSKIRQGKEKILVAEDNEGVRLLIKKILSKYGYKIIEAVDGEDAIEKFHKNKKVDLVILDSVMPKKNGREVYNEIIKINPDIKVLFTSGYTRDVVLNKGIEEKEFDFLSKPITPKKILNKVGEILNRK